MRPFFKILWPLVPKLFKNWLVLPKWSLLKSKRCNVWVSHFAMQYFLHNISAKNYQNKFIFILSQKWDVLWTQCSNVLLQVRQGCLSQTLNLKDHRIQTVTGQMTLVTAQSIVLMKRMDKHQKVTIVVTLALPMTIIPNLARVSATFKRLGSLRNPTPWCSFDLTHDNTMKSFSRPWNASTLATSISCIR